MQGVIDFEVHAFEKGAGNQMILDENRFHFSCQCKTLFLAFLSGKKITSHSSVEEFRIVDLRARLGDLRKNGVRLSWVPSENGRSKSWFMTESDREFNKMFLRPSTYST